MTKTFGLYATVISAILAWWYLAFKPSGPVCESNDRSLTFISHASFPKPPQLPHLSSLDRNLIQKALSGDIKLMAFLIAEWDIDAQIMEQNGLFGVKRLERKAFLQAQILSRKICELHPLDPSNQEYVMDDIRVQIRPDPKYNRFLPQTYVAASFLLALSDPSQIVAIPHGLRNETHLYPKHLTDLIPCDADRYPSEKLYREKPDIAFIAHYSHPSTLQAYQNQGIQLFMLKGELNTIFDISEALQKIGSLVNQPAKSTLLALFMESAMISIDNRMLALHAALEKDHPTKVMFLHHFTHYSHPTAKTITGQLLRRLKSYDFSFMPDSLENRKQWLIPVDQEKILDYNPDCLIIAATDENKMNDHFYSDSTLHQISAVKHGQVYLVESSIQQSPTQYMILAYYDLANALAHIQ